MFGDSDTVLVSGLGKNVRANLGEVQDALYDGVVNRGWFTERPDRTRSKWATIGIAAPSPAISYRADRALSRPGACSVSPSPPSASACSRRPPHAGQDPRRRPRPRPGRRDPGRAAGDGRQRAAHRPAREPCSRALPYAVVLGGAERWIDALVETDADENPDEGFRWYRGPPAGTSRTSPTPSATSPQTNRSLSSPANRRFHPTQLLRRSSYPPGTPLVRRG